MLHGHLVFFQLVGDGVCDLERDSFCFRVELPRGGFLECSVGDHRVCVFFSKDFLLGTGEWFYGCYVKVNIGERLRFYDSRSTHEPLGVHLYFCGDSVHFCKAKEFVCDEGHSGVMHDHIIHDVGMRSFDFNIVPISYFT